MEWASLKRSLGSVVRDQLHFETHHSKLQENSYDFFFMTNRVPLHSLSTLNSEVK